MLVWLGPPLRALAVHHREEMALGAALLSASDLEIHGADLKFAA